ncbi:MAG: SRPBCC family protein [Methylomonas sp.]|jgi:ribosome-associated toxin RatA of RatAB toxin-antitoxin module|uniref:SRPBCC family protein n=1 Tax=Methylomonas sp. TaxID=418 RepID=UPI0025E33668|nr:SRPBCC family protein [Methylomonas sp.]MCK9605697.1 SRPBCC family protein [Methylomonas sp.]
MLALVLILAVVAVVFVLIVVRRPGDFQVTRSLLMAAPASSVFEQVNNLKKWDAWSPWAKLDPNANNVFQGPEAGVGAVMRWAGNSKVGEGSMTIVASQPSELIRFKLAFLKPFKATNSAEFTFQTEGEQTLVTWRMSGTNNFIGKVMGLFMNCDAMVGGQFEQGLAAIKAIVEAA